MCLQGNIIQQKEKEICICYNMNDPWGHYIRWNKLDKQEWSQVYVDSKNVGLTDGSQGQEVREMGRCWSKGTNFQI